MGSTLIKHWRHRFYSHLRTTLRCALNFCGLNRANRFTSSLAESMSPRYKLRLTDGRSLQLSCPNATALARASSLLVKEPGTIRWISEFADNDSLLDIGANVGTFSLFAAIRGHRVVSIEPESQNFALLNENIFVNKLDDRVRAYNVALSDAIGATSLFLSSFGAGKALHTVTHEVDFQRRPMNASFRQGVWMITLDLFLAEISDFFPAHIKIDVDGAESQIIAGACQTLRDPRLKSVLIEINEELPI